MFSLARLQSCALAPALLLLGASAVNAGIYNVGNGGSCHYANIQAAINAAEQNPGADTIRISRTVSYTAQELLIQTGQQLTLIGGFDTCDSTTPSGMTTISGSGGAARQVLRVYADTGAVVELHHLMIRDGDTSGGGEGGGIYFQGDGILSLHNSSVLQNTAGYGAGIYARGTGTNAELVFGQNVIVNNNTARHSGGGVYADQIEFSMLEPGSILMLNTAQGQGGGGYGGGLVILGKTLSSYAYIGSGVPGLGSIYQNTAVYGGGVAVVADDGDNGSARLSRLKMYTTVAGQPASIRGNTASQRGGGLFVRSYEGGILEGVFADAMLWNANLDENTAPAGAAAYIASSDDPLFEFASYSYLTINQTDGDPAEGWPPGAIACTPGQFCGSISGNRAVNGSNQPSGAVVQMEQRTTFSINAGVWDAQPPKGGVQFAGNLGTRLIQADHEGSVLMRTLLIADNDVSGPLITTSDDGRLAMWDATLSGNVIGGAHVLGSGEGTVDLRRSILSQDGKTSLNCNGCSKHFERMMVSERMSLDGGQSPNVVVAPPRFIDPERGDYRLRAASPAVDEGPPIANGGADALGLPRDVDLPIVVFGMRDLGAFERQTLLPLVLNADFDVDLRLWNALIPSAVSRDPAQNGSGPASSGSLRVNHSNFSTLSVIAAQQCIHLPGPGRYKLNGWGRGGAGPIATRDSAWLRWELRHNGGEACTDGVATAAGNHFLSGSSTWTRPAVPATIDVTDADWNWRSSITVSLMVYDNGVVGPPNNSAVGWFDGITLEVESLDDVIFADGFEP